MKLKKLAFYLVCFVCLPSLDFSLWALKEKHSTLTVEDFESLDDIDQSYWWFADNVKPYLSLDDQTALGGTGKRWLRLTGSSTKWYVGAFGKWIGTDATKYNAIRIPVLGTGPQSGHLTIKLDQDDTGHCSLEVDKNYVPIHDDRFEYNINVNWQGWRVLTIPFSEFYLSNPGAGDGIWHPAKKNGSCGLIDMQFVLCTIDKIGSVDVGIGKIEFIKLISLRPMTA